jgi:hypothetical protein
MKVFVCEEPRMLRGLHARWPYRRSHCRHDLHWLVRVRRVAGRCAGGRVHPVTVLPATTRRPRN